MAYMMTMIMVALLFMSFYVTGKDLFAPANVLILTFLISLGCAIYNISTWRFDIGGYTAFIVIISLLVSVICNSYFHGLYRNSMIRTSNEMKRLTPISEFFLLLFIAYMAICVLIQYKAIKSVGSDSFSALMHIYRQATAYGNGIVNVNSISSTMTVFATSLAYVTLFNVIYNFKNTGKLYKLLNCAIIALWIILFFLQGTRYDVFSMSVAAFILWYISRIHDTGVYQRLQIRQLAKIIIFAVILLYGFYVIKDLVGRRSEQTMMEYLTSYLGGSIPLFDSFIRDPVHDLKIFGQETFMSINNGLIRRGIIHSSICSYNKEFRSINGVDIGNVYTALRDYYHDFGFIGTIILHTIFSSIYSWLYEKQKVRGNYFETLVLARIYYCVVFYMFSNSFYARIISISFLEEVAVMWILFKLLIEKKVRFKFKN